jgi:2-deoxy-D-gluconate 3-dehydrogenase
MAEGLAEAGADIAGLSRSDDAPEVRAAIEGMGRRYHHIGCDLAEADVARLRAVVAEVVEKLGRLDILVNNAGTTHRAPALQFREDHWDEVLKVNLKALFFLCQEAGRVMVGQGGGKIVNIASMLSYQGGITVPAYTASKHGVEGVTKALANELAPHNVNVNAIAPGYMLTDLTAPLEADPDRNPAILARIPAGRWGTPEDLKGAVVFLASAASDYMHGAMIPVDGAWLAR